MCGIFVICGAFQDARARALKGAKEIRHRGPDWSGIRCVCDASGNHHAVAHERLAIVDPDSGEQPLTSADGTLTLAVNGEIYNHRDIVRELPEPYTFATRSDCECILPLYQQCGVQGLARLRGMYSFVLLDTRTGAVVAMRDHVGITPLYMGWSSDGALVFASEMKALRDACVRFELFPPGHVYDSREAQPLRRWYAPAWRTAATGMVPLALASLRRGLEEAVQSHLMSDVPWGVLLSGGLDSSLVAALACRHVPPASVHSFTIGLANSPDLLAAQEVADFLGTTHHAYTFTAQQGLDALEDLIFHLETYDVTTVRAATPMYLMSRKIKALGIKMVLSGEGADEMFGGYLYFHKAPSAESFHRETVAKVAALHQYDCLRANKATAAWGLEARVPFLDRAFLDQAMQLDTRAKLCGVHAENRPEKWALRQAFSDHNPPYLPENVLWRQKEQFSDGVGYGWIDALRDHARTRVSDAQMRLAPHLFPHNTPTTKEAYLYRALFERHFPHQSASSTVPGGAAIACSTEEALSWDPAFQNLPDCSGRAVRGVHAHAYRDEDVQLVSV